MKDNKKKVIIIALLILVILVGIKILIGNNKNRKNVNNANTSNAAIDEKNVKTLSDGTRLNNSTKMQEIKTIDGLEISNIQLTEKDNVSILLGTVTNKTNETKGDYPVNIIIYDENEKEITTIGGYIGEVNPGESTQLNSSATFDYANAYDFRIEKTE